GGRAAYWTRRSNILWQQATIRSSGQKATRLGHHRALEDSARARGLGAASERRGAIQNRTGSMRLKSSVRIRDVASQCATGVVEGMVRRNFGGRLIMYPPTVAAVVSATLICRQCTRDVTVPREIDSVRDRHLR